MAMVKLGVGDIQAPATSGFPERYSSSLGGGGFWHWSAPMPCQEDFVRGVHFQGSKFSKYRLAHYTYTQITGRREGHFKVLGHRRAWAGLQEMLVGEQGYASRAPGLLGHGEIFRFRKTLQFDRITHCFV